MSTSGSDIAWYKYDAWGNVIGIGGDESIAELNPIRYRGYYYDNETGFYYLNSRYYDPEIGRFINADDVAATTINARPNWNKNLFSYCDNNPVVRWDETGNLWETLFDVVSLAVSVVEVAVNPTDVGAWVGLVGDAVDLIPFVTGVGEITRAVRAANKASDTIEIAKAVDFSDDAKKLVDSLHQGTKGFTKSNARIGTKIHEGYKTGAGFNQEWKENRYLKGIRPDYVDFDNKVIYELKAFNPRSIKAGIKQLQKYNRALGGGFRMVLEVY